MLLLFLLLCAFSLFSPSLFCCLINETNLIAFDARTTSARELWRQMQAQRFVKANPDFKVNTNVSAKPDPPSVIFKFVDDTEKKFDSQNFEVQEILFDVHLELDRMDNEFEMAGKSLDD